MYSREGVGVHFSCTRGEWSSANSHPVVSWCQSVRHVTNELLLLFFEDSVFWIAAILLWNTMYADVYRFGKGGYSWYLPCSEAVLCSGFVLFVIFCLSRVTINMLCLVDRHLWSFFLYESLIIFLLWVFFFFSVFPSLRFMFSVLWFTWCPPKGFAVYFAELPDNNQGRVIPRTYLSGFVKLHVLLYCRLIIGRRSYYFIHRLNSEVSIYNRDFSYCRI